MGCGSPRPIWAWGPVFEADPLRERGDPFPRPGQGTAPGSLGRGPGSRGWTGASRQHSWDVPAERAQSRPQFGKTVALRVCGLQRSPPRLPRPAAHVGHGPRGFSGPRGEPIRKFQN